MSEAERALQLLIVESNLDSRREMRFDTIRRCYRSSGRTVMFLAALSVAGVAAVVWITGGRI